MQGYFIPVLFFLLLAAGCGDMGQIQPIVLDGIISREEWSDAKSVEMTGGGFVYLKLDSAYLYVAIRGTAPGWAHVYVGNFDSVSVLHASAALGKAVYKSSGTGNWMPVSSFLWELRDSIYSEELKNKQGDYLQANGWVANNNLIAGGTEFEFMISLEDIELNTTKFAFVHILDKQSPLFYPRSINDDALHKDLLLGNIPETLNFDLGAWLSIDFFENTIQSNHQTE